MAMVLHYGIMETSMMDTGLIMRHMGKVSSSSIVELCMKVNGLQIKLKGMESIKIQMVINIKVSG